MSAVPRVASTPISGRKPRFPSVVGGVLPTHHPTGMGQLAPQQSRFPLLGAVFEETLSIRASELAGDPRCCISEGSIVPTQATLLVNFAAHGLADHVIGGRARSAFGRASPKPATSTEGQDRRDVAKPPSPTCPEGKALGCEAVSLGVERRPNLATARKWASRHHAGSEHDQVLFRCQTAGGNGAPAGAPKGPQCLRCCAIRRTSINWCHPPIKNRCWNIFRVPPLTCNTASATHRHHRNVSSARATVAERNDIARARAAQAPCGVLRRIASATTALHAASFDEAFRSTPSPEAPSP